MALWGQALLVSSLDPKEGFVATYLATRRLNEIPSVQIEASRVTGYPKIPFTALRPEGHLEKFLEAIEWAIKVIESEPSKAND